MKSIMSQYWRSYAKIASVVIFIYFLVPFLLIGSNHWVFVSDGIAQMKPFLTYYHKHGLDISAYVYNGQFGLGNEMYGLFFYYLSSPLWLPLLVLPKSLLYQGIWVLIVVRILLGGFVFHTWLRLRYEALAEHWRVNLTISYVTMGFIVLCFVVFEWLDLVFILPLLMIGLDRLRSGKGHYLFIFSLTYMIISNFYIAVLLILFSLVYYVYDVLVEKRSWREEIRLFLTYSLSGIAATLFALPVLYIVYDSMTKSRLVGSSIKLFDTPFTMSFIDFVANGSPFSFNDGGLVTHGPFLYLPIGLWLILILLFFTKNITRRLKLVNFGVLVVLTCMMLYKPTYVLFHMMTLPSGFSFRMIFILTTFVLISIASMLNDYYRNSEVSRLEYIVRTRFVCVVFIVLAMGMIYSFWLSDAVNIYGVWYGLLLCGLYFLSQFVFPNRRLFDRPFVLETVVSGSVLMFMMLVFGGFGQLLSVKDSNKLMNDVASANVDISDNYLYRAGYNRSSILNLFDGVSTVDTFTSNRTNHPNAKFQLITSNSSVAYGFYGDTDSLLHSHFLNIYGLFDTSKYATTKATKQRVEAVSDVPRIRKGDLLVNDRTLRRFYLTNSSYKVENTTIRDLDALFASIYGASLMESEVGLTSPTVSINKGDPKALTELTFKFAIKPGETAKVRLDVTSDRDGFVYLPYLLDVGSNTKPYIPYDFSMIYNSSTMSLNGGDLKTVTSSWVSPVYLTKGMNSIEFNVSNKSLSQTLDYSVSLRDAYRLNYDKYNRLTDEYNIANEVDVKATNNPRDVYTVRVDKANSMMRYIDSSVPYDSNFHIDDNRYRLTNNQGFLRITKATGDKFIVGDEISIRYSIKHITFVFVIWFSFLGLFVLWILWFKRRRSVWLS